MHSLNALIFGLGIFFLGLRLVGDNLKGLCSGSFRDAIAATTRRPFLRAGLGLSAGALMQSATAVTFICVSMVAAGFLSVPAAAGVIVWSNVGLTALAFVATLDIHPAVAFVSGGAGIVLGVVRIRFWQIVASVFLGIGLILYGLHQMSEGAAPLKDVAWFRAGIDLASSSAPLAFLFGILAAAILQSNTGATMMVITLAGAGALHFEVAAVLIYGTNLGAIALRLLLAAGMKGDGLRLVRMEDLFCFGSGALMMGLYFLENAGVPLVMAFSSQVAHSLPAQLAVVFLLSNLLPALCLTPFLGLCMGFLKKMFPADVEEDAGKPLFLNSNTLEDPPTAIELLRKELVRLLELIDPSTSPTGEADEAAPPRAFARLAQEIESFAAKLGASPVISAKDIFTLHRLRSVLSGVRHLQEAVGFFSMRSAQFPQPKRGLLESLVKKLLQDCATALKNLDSGDVLRLRDSTKNHGPFLRSMRREILPSEQVSGELNAQALYEDVHLLGWTVHRLAKLLLTIPRPPGSIGFPAEQSSA